MSLLGIISVALMLIGAAVLYYSAQKDGMPKNIHRRFNKALEQENIRFRAQFGQYNLHQLLHNILKKVSQNEISEVQGLLIQAGWPGNQAKLTFLIIAWLLPLILGFSASFYALLSNDTFVNIVFHFIFLFAATFVLVRRTLRWKAKKRQNAIRKEVIPFLHLLSMLFEAGMSMEHILIVIVQQGRDLIPQLAGELQSVTSRIQSGQDRADALEEMAMPLQVPELSDTIAMLKQVTRYGGNIQESLENYTILVEQRQVSELREYVSKLSAKMTVVMILFLFPALMIFLAGPGFVGLAKALKGVGGL